MNRPDARDCACFCAALAAAALVPVPLTTLGELAWATVPGTLTIVLFATVALRYLVRDLGRPLRAAVVDTVVVTLATSAVLSAVIVVMQDRTALRSTPLPNAPLAALFGAIAGIFVSPLTVLFVVIVRWISARRLVDLTDRVLFAGGTLVAFAGAYAALSEANRPPPTGSGSIVVLAIAPLLLIAGAVKTARRARWLRSALAGRIAGFVVLEATPDDDALPAYGPRLREPVVIASAYRTGEAFRASPNAVVRIARFDRAGHYGAMAPVAVVLALGSLMIHPVVARKRAFTTIHAPLNKTWDEPHAAPNMGPFTDFAVGDEAVCARTPAGRFTCWGSQAGFVERANLQAERVPFSSSLGPGDRMFLGFRRACVLQAAPSSADCIGANAVGVDIVQVAFTKTTTLSLLADGHVRAGDIVPGLEHVTQLAASFTHVCALDTHGDVLCAEEGGVAGGRFRPVALPSRADRIGEQYAASWAHISGHWWRWTPADPEPVYQRDWDGFEEVVFGGEMVCGRTYDGDVTCAASPKSPPLRMNLPGMARKIAAGNESVCADIDGALWCWGNP